MERIKLYESFELSKKNSFQIFLDVIEEFGYKFNSQDYMNTGTYSYFFQTDIIKIDIKLLDSFEFKTSLHTAYGTLMKLKGKRISFYFGVKETSLEYGFFDIDAEMVYKIGEFNININYLKSLKNRCLISIKKQLNNSNIRFVYLLHKVKNLSKDMIKSKGKTKFLDEYRMVISYDKNIFSDLNDDKLNNFVNNWLIDNKLNKSYIGHVNITDDSIDIYLNVKDIETKTFNTTTNIFN